MRGGGWGIGGNRESGKKKDWKERIVRRNVRNKKIHVLKRKDPGKTKSNIHAWKGNNIKKRTRDLGLPAAVSICRITLPFGYYPIRRCSVWFLWQTFYGSVYSVYTAHSVIKEWVFLLQYSLNYEVTTTFWSGI